MFTRQLQATIYHNLRVLLEETDTATFETLLHATLQNLSTSKDTQGFRKYFVQYYVRRKEQWAACYRTGSLINTNMYVEAFHSAEVHVPEGKSEQASRIHVLMKFARDKGFDRLIKLEKDKLSRRIRVMHRHRTSLTLPYDHCTRFQKPGIHGYT